MGDKDLQIGDVYIMDGDTLIGIIPDATIVNYKDEYMRDRTTIIDK